MARKDTFLLSELCVGSAGRRSPIYAISADGLFILSARNAGQSPFEQKTTLAKSKLRTSCLLANNSLASNLLI